MADSDDSARVDEPLARSVAVGLAAGRVAIGAGIWLAPGVAWKALGFGEAPRGAALALGRLAATRDLVLGGWQLAAVDDRDRLRRLVAAGTLVDAADALAFGLALREDGMRDAAIRGLAAAAGATVAGAWMARRLRASES
jgi:hypothetical protein